jgi:peroxiredoxin
MVPALWLLRFMGAMASCMACSGVVPAPQTAEASSHPLLGAPAPDFKLQEAGSSREHSLGQHAGKLVLVDFWATWCEPCKQSFPAYQQLLESMSGELVVLGISQDDDPKGIQAFRAETGVTFPLLWDESKTAARSYDPPTMPTAYVVDKSGIVRFVHAGYRSGDEQTIGAELRAEHR